MKMHPLAKKILSQKRVSEKDYMRARITRKISNMTGDEVDLREFAQASERNKYYWDPHVMQKWIDIEFSITQMVDLHYHKMEIAKMASMGLIETLKRGLEAPGASFDSWQKEIKREHKKTNAPAKIFYDALALNWKQCAAIKGDLEAVGKKLKISRMEKSVGGAKEKTIIENVTLINQLKKKLNEKCEAQGIANFTDNIFNDIDLGAWNATSEDIARAQAMLDINDFDQTIDAAADMIFEEINKRESSITI